MCELVAQVRKQLRHEDQVVRWGGEEFIVMMPMTGIEGALITSERLRKNIESHTFPHGKQVTSSFGVGQYDGTDKKEFLLHIDEALYYAKEKGRNQVKQIEFLSSRENA